MKTIAISFLSIFIFSFNCIANPKDSVHFKKINFGFEIPYSTISKRNLESVSKQTATGNTLFFTGLSLFFKYNISKQFGLQLGISAEAGQYPRKTPGAVFVQDFKEIQIPFKIAYTFNKGNKHLNFFTSIGYSLDFIFNRNNEGIFLPTNDQIIKKYFQSTFIGQIGILYSGTKIKPFISFNSYYSSFWKEYYGLSIGAYF